MTLPLPSSRHRLAWLLSGAALLAACASAPPPTEQMAVTTAAVTDALQAGGTRWAPAEMLVAQDKLAQANAALAAHDNPRALQLAEQAQADAQLAQAKAQTGKARQAADEVKDASRVLREEMGRKTP